MNRKIEELRQQIAQEEAKIRNCKHDFKDPIYDPEEKNEPYGFRTVGQGSDVWTEPEGYRKIGIPRWSRECKLCGVKEYTYEQEPVITDYKPKF